MNKYAEMLKEAKWTVTALVALIFFWLIAGIFGTNIEMSIYSIPAWAVFGTLGVWTFAIIIAIILSRNISDVEL